MTEPRVAEGESLKIELLKLILSLFETKDAKYIADNPKTECAYYPNDKKLVVINNVDSEEKTNVKTDVGTKTVTLNPFDIEVIDL